VTEAVLKIGVDSTDVNKAKKSLDDLAAASASATTSTDRLSETTSELGSSAKAAGNEVDANTKKIDNSYKTMGGSVASSIGKVVAALGLMQVGRMFADTVMETEKLRGALTTMTGSTENAAAAFENLTKFASETPFTLDQSVNAFIKLKALGLDPSERALQSYGNTASAMGKDMMQMIEAVADASTGEFERLKEFGIKAKSEGDNVALTFQGVTTTIGKNSEEIQAYLLAIGEVQFAGAMENQMQRLPGLMSNLQDNIDGLFRKLGDSGGINLFGKAISLASGAVLLLTDNLDLIGTALGAAGAAFAVLAAPAAILGGIAMIQKAVIAMNAAILANPIAAVAAAIGAAAFVIYKYWDDIALAAKKAWINIQISFNEFRIYLIENFGAAADAFALIFGYVKATALGVWGAIKTGASLVVDGFNSIKTAAESVAINIEIAWTSLKDFLGNSFSTALSAIMNLFDDVKNKAIATWAAVSEATKNPLTAVDTFNTTFAETLTSLENAETKTNAFSTSAASSRTRVEELQAKLAALNATTATTSTNIGTSDTALSDFSTTANSSEGQINALTTAVNAENEALRSVDLTLGEVSISTEGLSTTTASTVDSLGGSIELWTKLSKAGSEQRAAAEIESQKKQEEAMTRTHEYLTTSFIDIFNNGKNAFDNIAKAFSTMIQRMLAEWAASKLMNLIGMGSGTATANPFAAIGSAISSAIGGTAATAAGTAAAGAAGTAAAGAAGGAAAGTGIGATLASAAGSVGTAISGGAAAVGSAISGGASAATAMIVANPLLAAAALAAAAAAALAKKPTTSSNAGLLIHDAPGASADRKFAVDAFASGFAPVGFARREDQASANEVIDVFRKYDASLTEIAKAAGLNVNFSNNPFGGFDEKGQGSGLFLGTAAEEGRGVTSAPMSEQLTQFTKQWVEALGGQVSPADREFLLSSGSADVLLERAATLGQAERGRLDGIGFGGIRNVPFNGFRAELHKGEEVLTASDPRNRNNGGMMSEMRDMLTEMRNMAFYTKRTADLLLRVTRDGDSLVTVAA
jgi:hypothetical protein